MARTSSSQFEVMVEYMESNGDLNKFADGPNGRITAHNKWTELVRVLNMDTTGSSKPVEKWKKVWSDLKNNTKRKAAKIHCSASGTGGGPACRLILTDLEQRVLNLTGTLAVTGLISIPEVGVETTSAECDTAQEQQQVPPPPPQYFTSPRENIHIENTTVNENRPGTSQEQVESYVEEIEGVAVSPTPHYALVSPRRIEVGARRVIRPRRTSQRHRHTRPVDAASLFAGTEERWQNFATEFANEHIRLRERELEQQSQLQTQWQTLGNYLEQRVLNLTGTQAVTGLISIPEVGVETTSAECDTAQEQQQVPPPPPQYFTSPRENIHIENTTVNENRPGTSQEQVEFYVEEIEGVAVSPTPHYALVSPRRIEVGARRVIRPRRTSPRHRHTRPVDAASLFAGTEERWQNFATEFATEHVRLREQQSQWQTLFGKLLVILENFIKKP